MRSDLFEGPLRRRELLQGGAGLALGLAGCGVGEGGSGTTAKKPAKAKVIPAKPDGDLVYFNWSEYLDPKLMKEFEKLHGVKVRESNFDSMQGMMAKLRSGNRYDLIFPGSEWTDRLIRANQLLRFDPSQLKNAGTLSRNSIISVVSAAPKGQSSVPKNCCWIRFPITVFQSYALFEHLDVEGNVAFGLKRRKVAADEIRTRVAEALELVRLTGRESARPNELSGGQRQRVALARALVNRPAVLLLDEPLGALDLKLRKEMQVELKAIQREVGITFLYVTHDQEEALAMSDRIAVMTSSSRPGRGSSRWSRTRTARARTTAGRSARRSPSAGGRSTRSCCGSATA